MNMPQDSNLLSESLPHSGGEALHQGGESMSEDGANKLYHAMIAQKI